MVLCVELDGFGYGFLFRHNGVVSIRFTVRFQVEFDTVSGGRYTFLFVDDLGFASRAFGVLSCIHLRELADDKPEARDLHAICSDVAPLVTLFLNGIFKGYS